MLASGRWWRLAALAGAVIVAFDVVAALVSRRSGIPYSRFAYGSYVIQAGTGFTARRVGLPFADATFLGTWVGLVEATIGWAVSWWIGPGRTATVRVPATIVLVVAFVAILATAIGALGAWLGQLGRSRMEHEA